MINFCQPSFFASKAPKLYDFTCPITDMMFWFQGAEYPPVLFFLMQLDERGDC